MNNEISTFNEENDRKLAKKHQKEITLNEIRTDLLNTLNKLDKKHNTNPNLSTLQYNFQKQPNILAYYLWFHAFIAITCFINTILIIILLCKL